MCVMFLDDVRKPWNEGFMGAVWVKTSEEAIKLLQTGTVEFASLDHDLSDVRACGLTHTCKRCNHSFEKHELKRELPRSGSECVLVCPHCGSWSIQEEDNGMRVLDFLEANPALWPANGVRIHTMNPSMYNPMRAVVCKYYGKNFED